jgi:hypothetical protein
MPFPPEDNSICSCCGTEFGYDDANKTYAEIAQNWTRHGAKWFSSYVTPPAHWNPWLQLIDAQLGYQIPWISRVRVTNTVQYVDTIQLQKDPQFEDVPQRKIDFCLS